MSINHELFVNSNELFFHFLTPHFTHAHRASKFHELRVNDIGEFIELNVDYLIIFCFDDLEIIFLIAQTFLLIG
jgi:hypothetical protein